MQKELKQAFTKEDAYLNLDRVNGWISSCDTKASILFAVLGVIVGLTTDVFQVFSFLKNICRGTVEPTGSNIILLVFQMLFITVYFVATILSVLNLINVLKARVEPANREKVAKSVLHFWSISKRTDVDFIKECNEITEEQLIEDINEQVWINSGICDVKFKHQKKALRWILVAGALAIVMLILVNLI